MCVCVCMHTCMAHMCVADDVAGLFLVCSFVIESLLLLFLFCSFLND